VTPQAAYCCPLAGPASGSERVAALCCFELDVRRSGSGQGVVQDGGPSGEKSGLDARTDPLGGETLAEVGPKLLDWNGACGALPSTA